MDASAEILVEIFHAHKRNYPASHIRTDPRRVTADDLFFAVKGKRFDANHHIKDALDKHARFIIHDKPSLMPSPKLVKVPNVDDCLRIATGIFYPKTPATLVAVTGTNGKTSVVIFTQKILQTLQECASFGTHGIHTSRNDQTLNELARSPLTTPENHDLRAYLHHLSNVPHVTFEASSHGIAQNRLQGINVDACVITNLAEDHLDYHKTLEEYFKVKMRLIDYVKPHGVVIIDADILDDYPHIYGLISKRMITIGSSGDCRIVTNRLINSTRHVHVYYRGEDFHFQTRIVASYHVKNLLLAAVLIDETTPFHFRDIICIAEGVDGVEMRLERITNVCDGFQVFVDCCHTPETLETNLNELTALFKCDGAVGPHEQLVVFFSSSKAHGFKLMEKIARKWARQVDCAEGVDRTSAIRRVIGQLMDGDILMIVCRGCGQFGGSIDVTTARSVLNMATGD